MESVSYDRAAEYYDVTRALPAKTMAELTDLLAGNLAGHEPCLEIGVGTGRFALPLRERGITIVGTDISRAMLRRLVANAGGRSPLPLARADATRLPFGGATFGSVVAAHVLHIIPRWRTAVDEALRVLRPGGALIASFPTDDRPSGVPERPDLAGLLNSVDALGTMLDGGAPWAGAVRDSANRQGMSLAPVGAPNPGAVAAYLDGRATVRYLSPVRVRFSTTLGEVIEGIGRQLFTWTWPHTAEQASMVAGDVLAWAEHQNMPVGTVHETETASRWWVFEVRVP